jgi:type II secretory ATPase GspE/PulE/Tfp pilus assembly ATPase PilB-like protein
MSDAIERPKSYEEGLRDGFVKGQEEAQKIIEQMAQTSCKPIVCSLPETEAIKLLNEQIMKMRCCENCKHHGFMGNELICHLGSYDTEFECMKTKSHWELNEE